MLLLQNDAFMSSPIKTQVRTIDGFHNHRLAEWGRDGGAKNEFGTDMI